MASPTSVASVRIFFIRASGLNGLPFSMPSDFNIPIMMRSRSCTGSSLIQWASASQQAKPRGAFACESPPPTETTLVAGGLAVGIEANLAPHRLLLLSVGSQQAQQPQI